MPMTLPRLLISDPFGRSEVSRTFEFGSEREATPLRIVADAAIATDSVSEGRLVPLLIIDAAHRPEMAELIRVHGSVHPGDVSIQWGLRNPKKDGDVLLVLEFERPLVLTVALAFQIASQGALVDLILHARAFYLQIGRPGDRFLTTQDRPKLFIEAPHTGFEAVWDKLWLSHLTKDLRGRGLSGSQAKTAAADYLTQLRRISAGRVKG
jgi:hypothetical protein